MTHYNGNIGNEMKGMIVLHQGDESEFKAKKVK
jgi:hypothetical protein